MKHHDSYIKIDFFYKNTENAVFGMDMEEFLDFANGIAKWCSCFGIKLGSFLENETHLLCTSAITLPARETKNNVHTQ